MSNTGTVRNAGIAGAALGATVVKEVGSIAASGVNAWSSVWAAKKAQDAAYVKTLPKEKQKAERERLAKETTQGQADSILILIFIGAVAVALFNYFF